MHELEGTAAIVTGAARNIGRAIALDLADGGASVALATRADLEGVAEVAAEIDARGGRALVLRVDVTDPDAVKRMVADTLAAFGRLDILVNNAGLRPESALEDMTLAEWRAVMATTLEGPFLCCQAALEALTQSGRGAIVNIGGMTAYTGAIHRAHVVAAKAGLDGLTKALAIELAPRSITVNLVAPGMIDTKRAGAEPEHRKERIIPAGRRGHPEDVSAMVRHLAGPKGRYLTGQTIHISGGVYMP